MIKMSVLEAIEYYNKVIKSALNNDSYSLNSLKKIKESFNHFNFTLKGKENIEKNNLAFSVAILLNMNHLNDFTKYFKNYIQNIHVEYFLNNYALSSNDIQSDIIFSFSNDKYISDLLIEILIDDRKIGSKEWLKTAYKWIEVFVSLELNDYLSRKFNILLFKFMIYSNELYFSKLTLVFKNSSNKLKFFQSDLQLIYENKDKFIPILFEKEFQRKYLLVIKI